MMGNFNVYRSLTGVARILNGCHSWRISCEGGMRGKIRRDIGLSAHATLDDLPRWKQIHHRDEGNRRNMTHNWDVPLHLWSIFREKKVGKIPPTSSPPSGLDQQHSYWCTITTSMQTPAATDANLPLWAIVRGISWLAEHVTAGGFWGGQF
jgi:hypothetical protein